MASSLGGTAGALSLEGFPEAPGVSDRREQEGGRRCRDVSSTARKMPARHDEFRGEPVTPEVLGSLGVVHTDGEVLVDFKVEVRGVHALVVTDRSDLLSPGDLLSLADIDPFQMRVQGVGKVELSVFNPGMADDDHISPGDMDVAGQHDDAVTNRVDRLAESLGASPVGDPIFPHVPSGTESPGFVVAVSLRGGDRKVKAIGCPGNGLSVRLAGDRQEKKGCCHREGEAHGGDGRHGPRLGKCRRSRNRDVIPLYLIARKGSP